jgi:hypothetical protein
MSTVCSLFKLVIKSPNRVTSDFGLIKTTVRFSSARNNKRKLNQLSLLYMHICVRCVLQVETKTVPLTQAIPQQYVNYLS